MTEEEVFNLCYPLGASYCQLPQTKSPNEIFGDYSAWEIIGACTNGVVWKRVK